MVALVARTGRQLQKYNSKGRRLVVGCIPYRLKEGVICAETMDQAFEILVITSQKGRGIMFPKGGWEIDESLREAAVREALEEAGVKGILKKRLGKWCFRSRRYDTLYEGYMFPLYVTDELDLWPEKSFRERKWVSVAEIREECQHLWMKEALERLVERLARSYASSRFKNCDKTTYESGGFHDICA